MSGEVGKGDLGQSSLGQSSSDKVASDKVALGQSSLLRKVASLVKKNHIPSARPPGLRSRGRSALWPIT